MRKKFIPVCLLLLLGLSVVGNKVPQIDLGLNEAYGASPFLGIPSIEPVPSPPSPFMLLSINNGARLLVSTSQSTVYVYDGESFTKIFDISIVGDRYVFGLFQDEQGNIYISPQHNGTVWRSSDGGQSWTHPLNMVAHGGETIFSCAPKSNWYDFRNGTILAGHYAHMGPYVYRSDNWGLTWFLWKNFTAIFPEYAIEDPLNKPAYWIRHVHAVFYVPTENTLFVSLGDLLHCLYKSSDGGNTWALAYPHGFTSYVTLADRVLLGTDGDVPIMLYQSQSFKPVWIPKGKNASYYSANIFRSFVYDGPNDVLYVGVGTDPAAAHNTYYTAILASTDKGETWTPITTLDNSPTSNREAPDLALYGEYIYYSWGGVLKRFKRLSQSEVSFIHNQDGLTKIVVDRTHMSSSTKVLKNPKLMIESASLTNLLTNPSFETWSTPPMGWSGPWASWAGSRTYASGVGYHGSNSYKLILGGNGTTIVSTIPALQLTKGYYTLSAYVKTNASHPRAWAYILTKNYDVSTSGYRMTGSLLGEWQKIESQFYLETDKAQSIWLRIDVPFGYVINATVEWDAVALHKHPSYYGSNAPFFTENFNVPYTTTLVSTTNGSLVLGNQTIMFTTDELPKTVWLGDYWIGHIPIRLLSGNIVNLTISGENVFEVSNATIERKGTGVIYIGKMYDGFNIVNNVENALFAFCFSPHNITSAIFNFEVLTINIDATAGSTSRTHVYVGERGAPRIVYALNGTPSWSYNSSTKILEITISHSGPAEIMIDWRMPGDANGDGVVNIIDLALVGTAYGSSSGDPCWKRECDLNRDLIVDVLDLATVAKNYGQGT